MTKHSAVSTTLELMGAPGSPYTRKLLALLRYRRIPHAIHWSGHPRAPAGYPAPPVALLPTVYFPLADGGREAVVDTSPILRRLEATTTGRSVIPTDPVLAFLNFLIEDYADEWLTKAMFHYRWAHEADAANARQLLIYWFDPTLPPDEADALGTAFANRQIGRLSVVGSTPQTAETIEASYSRALPILDHLIARGGFVFGRRPASADFALYGQLCQLAIIEPTSAAIAARTAPRVRAWLDLMEDLSGLAPDEGEWRPRAQALEALAPLLAEIGRVYAPFLVANARAVSRGASAFETVIDGRPWRQDAMRYQAKCLDWIGAEFAALNAEDQAQARDALASAGALDLIEIAPLDAGSAER